MDTNEQYALAMRGIRKSFGEVDVLKNVDFSLKKGEIHALIGENGAGKSTLIKGLIGVHAFDEGCIYLDDEKKCFDNASDAADNGIKVVFQELSEIRTLTVAENIFLRQTDKNSLSLLNRKVLYEKADQLLNQYNIDIDSHEVVENLIVAKRQLLEIIKAVSCKPRILILDEPTSSLTLTETDLLFEILNKLKEDGTSIIYITHRMNEVFTLADRITILRDGVNVCETNTSDIDFDGVVKEMVGREVKLFKADENAKRKSKNDTNVLEVNNLCKRGEFQNISFTLKRGEVLGFAGLVGSGRTELMQILFGIRKASSGQIVLDGKDITNKSTSQIIKAGLAMVPEARHEQGLMLMHSVEENICITTLDQLSCCTMIERKKVSGLAENMIDKLNIVTDSPKKTIGLLSGGNQQKAVLAKWLAVKPKVLILDEPTTGIDVQAKSEIHKLISELSAEGTSIILISSEMPELISNSDRILILNENRIIGEICENMNQELIMDVIMKDKLQTNSIGGVGR